MTNTNTCNTLSREDIGNVTTANDSVKVASESASTGFSRLQIALLVLWGAVWLGLNAAWVQASYDFAYIHDDSIYHVGACRQMFDGFKSMPWWKWDIPLGPPPLMFLITLVLSSGATDPLFSRVVTWCFVTQATIMLVSYAAVAWLGRVLYGARVGFISALLFLSFYFVESAVRNHMCDSLLGLMVTLAVAFSWLMRRNNYSLLTCIGWSLCLMFAFFSKLSALWQWLALLLLYHFWLLGRNQVAAAIGNRVRAWLRVGVEIAIWVALGLAVAAIEYKLGIRQVVALLAVGLAIIVWRELLRKTAPLRRFSLVTGAGLTVCALMWFRMQSSFYYSIVKGNNTTYSGDLLTHIVQDWPGLCLALVLLLIGGVLLPVAGSASVACCLFSFIKPRRFAPNLEMICLIIVPGICVNAFFFLIVNARFYLPFLGLLAVIMGSVLVWAPSWVRWPLVGWCLLAKLVFLGGWLFSNNLPSARDCYLQSNDMSVPGITYRENDELGKIRQYACLQSAWSSSVLFTAYPYHLDDLELLYRVWEKQANIDDLNKERVLIATLNDSSSNGGFHSDYYTLEELYKRRSSHHVCPAGVPVNTALFKFHHKDLTNARTLAVLTVSRGSAKQRLRLAQNYVDTYWPKSWKLAELYDDGNGYCVAVFRAETGWTNKIDDVLIYPPVPLLQKVSFMR